MFTLCGEVRVDNSPRTDSSESIWCPHSVGEAESREQGSPFGRRGICLEVKGNWDFNRQRCGRETGPREHMSRGVVYDKFSDVYLLVRMFVGDI